MSKISSLVIFALAILLTFFSIQSASPPPVRLGEVPDSTFSVKNAYTHLLQISKLPHSTGSSENNRVREYIAAECRKFGFTVNIQNTISFSNQPGRINAANVFNIIAQKRGLHNSKSVMVMSHYDSQMNTPGAGDDGAGVASMLETASALQKINLQNDLILLFTDGEEIGLMGANAFVKDSLLVKELGIVINFEGRGNAGPSNMFEVNEKNGWSIDEYAKSVAHPFANSLGYEIYKRLPNYTDITPFKNLGISVLNNAYIEGFVNYHSPNDKPGNMDQRSLQHHGDNMLSLVKHFGNLNITNTKAPDASYFNVIGNWFIHYPASWNLKFVVLTDLLFILFMVVGLKNKKIKPLRCILAIFLFAAVLAIIYYSAEVLVKFIISRYPMYSHFDENNSYNSSWYFLALSAWGFTIFSFIYYLVSKKLNIDSLLAGIVLIVVILMNGMQYATPSASYLLFIPLLFILAGRLIVFSKDAGEGVRSKPLIFLNFISVVPAICLLAPCVYFTFIAFALGNNVAFVVISVGMVGGLLLPVLYSCFKDQQLLIPFTAFICFLGAMFAGHRTSGFSAKYPLQSSLWYTLDVDSSRAEWVSDLATDKWTAGFFKNVNTNYPNRKDSRRLVNDAPVLPLLPPSAIVTDDTLQQGRRKMTVHLDASRQQAIFINVSIADSSNVKAVSINGIKANESEERDHSRCRSIGYTGLTGNGIDITFELEGNKKLDIIVNDLSIGLPAIPGFNTSYPKDIIPAQGNNSNTIQVRKHFIL